MSRVVSVFRPSYVLLLKRDPMNVTLDVSTRNTPW